MCQAVEMFGSAQYSPDPSSSPQNPPEVRSAGSFSDNQKPLNNIQAQVDVVVPERPPLLTLHTRGSAAQRERDGAQAPRARE